MKLILTQSVMRWLHKKGSRLFKVRSAQRYLEVVAGTSEELIKARKKTKDTAQQLLTARLKECQEPPAAPLITGCWHLTPCRKCFSRGWLKTNLSSNPTLEQISGTWQLIGELDRLLFNRSGAKESTDPMESTLLSFWNH